MSEIDPKKNVKYRVELQKKLEINKSYKERRNRAIAIRILSYGLFGQKRFQNLYLSCSLNCFYWALQIANFLHQKVAGLAMIIKFEQVHVIEYYEKELENGKTYAEQKYTKIVIKLTKSPSEEDKKDPGFNPGFSSENIKGEMTDIIGNKRGDPQKGDRPQRQRRTNRGGNRGRGDRNTQRRDREDRPERRDREDRPERRYREDRPERRDRQDRRDGEDRRGRDERRDRDQNRRDEHPRREPERRERRERDDDRDRRPRRYGDDRDERRIYKDEGKQERGNNDRYERGVARTRGGQGSRYQQSERRQQRPRYEAKQASRPAREERPAKEDRGDRRPKRAPRYSEDED